MWKSGAGEAAIRRLSAEVVRIDRLIRVAAADDAGRPPFPRDDIALKWLAAEAERLEIKRSAPKPIVMGRHLVKLGLRPGVEFGRLLSLCYEAQLDGKIKTLDDGLALLESISRKA